MQSLCNETMLEVGINLDQPIGGSIAKHEFSNVYISQELGGGISFGKRIAGEGLLACQ